MFTIYDGRNTFYQWDIDRKLIVDDETITQVHFCNKTDDCSLVCEVYTEGEQRLVNVPNILLQDNWRINVYAYDGQHTKHSATFDVISRTKPADYIYTETEILQYSGLEKRVEALEDAPKDSGYYYSSLSAALSDVNSCTYENALTEATAAKAKVFTADNGKLTIMLLDDVTETEYLRVEASADINLSGYELSLANNATFVLSGADVALYGGVNPITNNRGRITKTNSGKTSSVAIMQVKAPQTVIEGIDLYISDTTSSILYGIYCLKAALDCTISNCNIEVNTAQKDAYGIVAFESLTANNVTINVNSDSGGSACGCLNNSAYGNLKADRCTITSTIGDTSATYYARGIWNYGSAVIENSSIEVSANESHITALDNYSGTMTIDNCNVSVRTETNGKCKGAYNATDAEINITNSHFKAVYAGDTADTSAHGLYNVGTAKAKDSTFHADAKGGSVDIGAFSIGVMNVGTAYLENCNVTGTHSGMQQSGHGYINGGKYVGTQHGGVYIGTAPEEITYINDVKFYDGNYDGEFTDVWANKLHWGYCWGSVYIGGSGRSGIVAYFDGCEFNGMKHAIVMRGSLGETNNTANLSNCTFGLRSTLEGNCTINFHNNTHTVNVGLGCTNIDESVIFTAPELNVEIVDSMMPVTNELYRKHNKDYVLKGADFEALANYIKA